MKNIGLVGCGNIAETYFRSQEYFNNIKFVSCADINEETAKKCAEKYNINSQSVDDLMCRIDDIKSEPNQILIEEMVEPNIMELLVGVTKDETGLFAMTLSPGGILSELHAKISTNKKTLILPTTEDIVADSLKSLPLSPLFEGYRGLLKANLTKTIEVIMKISSLIENPHLNISELEINPLIITNKNVYAADALIEINT